MAPGPALGRKGSEFLAPPGSATADPAPRDLRWAAWCKA